MFKDYQTIILKHFKVRSYKKIYKQKKYYFQFNVLTRCRASLVMKSITGRRESLFG